MQSAKLFFLAFILSLIFHKTSNCQEGTWVEVVGRSFGANITPEEGKRLAKQDAESEAIKQVVGVKVSEETFGVSYEKLDFKDKQKSESDETFLVTSGSSSSGLITNEEILSDSVYLDTKSNIPIYIVRIKAFVNRQEGTSDPSFSVNMELNKSIFFVRNNPDENDKMEIYIKSSQDCFLYLFCRTEDGQMLIIFPNELKKNNQFFGNRDNDQFMDLMKGAKINLDLPESKNTTVESLYLVATKEKVDFQSSNTSLFGIYNGIKNYKTAMIDIMNWIVQIPLEKRTSAVVSYEIRKENK